MLLDTSIMKRKLYHFFTMINFKNTQYFRILITKKIICMTNVIRFYDTQCQILYTNVTSIHVVLQGENEDMGRC